MITSQKQKPDSLMKTINNITILILPSKPALTGDLSNVKQRISSSSKADAEAFESRRHPFGNVLEYWVDPLVHADSQLAIIQCLLVEQSCKKHGVKLPQLEKNDANA